MALSPALLLPLITTAFGFFSDTFERERREKIERDRARDPGRHG